MVNPLIFAVIFAIVNGFFTALAAIVAGALRVGGAIAGYIGNVEFTPVLVAIFLFIGAGIYHLLIMLFVKPSNAGYEATFRVVAYASVILLVSWVASVFTVIPVIAPVIGAQLSLAVGVYGLYL